MSQAYVNFSQFRKALCHVRLRFRATEKCPYLTLDATDQFYLLLIDDPRRHTIVLNGAF